MDMVEKTRRSLTVLRRCQEADREELNYWIRRYSDAEELKKGAASGQSRQQSPAAQENAPSGGGITHTVHVLDVLKDNSGGASSMCAFTRLLNAIFQ